MDGELGDMVGKGGGWVGKCMGGWSGNLEV